MDLQSKLSNEDYDRFVEIVGREWYDLGISLPIYSDYEISAYADVFYKWAFFLFGTRFSPKEIKDQIKTHNDWIDCTCNSYDGGCWYRLTHREACENMAEMIVYRMIEGSR